MIRGWHVIYVNVPSNYFSASIVASVQSSVVTRKISSAGITVAAGYYYGYLTSGYGQAV